MRGQGKNALGMLGLAAVIVACGAGLALGNDKSSSPADFGSLFKVTEAKDQPAKTKKHKPSSEPPPMTCDGDQCWWTDLGRPDK